MLFVPSPTYHASSQLMPGVLSRGQNLSVGTYSTVPGISGYWILTQLAEIVPAVHYHAIMLCYYVLNAFDACSLFDRSL